MTPSLIAILSGMLCGVFAGYRTHRKWRLPIAINDERIGKMTHISEVLDGYLERKMMYNEKKNDIIN